MHLNDNLKKQYTEDRMSAIEAQRLAQIYAFGPMTFQTARLMVKWGIFEMLETPMTPEEVAEKAGISLYAAKCLLESSLTMNTVIVDPETGRYSLAKTGWFLLHDESTRVNLDFNHDVNYQGMFYLEEALREGKPAGLKCLGDWPTVYEGLSTLPEQAQKSWFAFDHFYSDGSFEQALELVFSRPTKHLMDVGGNTGRWAMQCVRHNPDVEVTIVDLPQQIGMMREQTAGQPGADRIHGYAANMLDDNCKLPSEPAFDAIWMSQFLDCFSEPQILSILRRAASVMTAGTHLYIMETFWDRQRFDTAALCLAQTSLYFTAIANGNSKMYHSDDLVRLVREAGLDVDEIHDFLGLGHSVLECTIR